MRTPSCWTRWRRCFAKRGSARRAGKRSVRRAGHSPRQGRKRSSASSASTSAWSRWTRACCFTARRSIGPAKSSLAHLRKEGPAGKRAVQVSAGHDAEVRPAAVGLFGSAGRHAAGGQHAVSEVQRSGREVAPTATQSDCRRPGRGRLRLRRLDRRAIGPDAENFASVTGHS